MSDLLDTVRGLAKKTDSKILMVVLDGVGGLPLTVNGDTELATARTPNLDALAQESQLGQLELVGAGITPAPAPATSASSGTTPSSTWWGAGRCPQWASASS